MNTSLSASASLAKHDSARKTFGVGDVSALVSALHQLSQASSVILSTESQTPVECDGLAVYQQLPLVTVLPETMNQVQAILRLCHLHGVPLKYKEVLATGLCAGAMSMQLADSFLVILQPTLSALHRGTVM